MAYNSPHRINAGDTLLRAGADIMVFSLVEADELAHPFISNKQRRAEPRSMVAVTADLCTTAVPTTDARPLFCISPVMRIGGCGCNTTAAKIHRRQGALLVADKQATTISLYQLQNFVTIAAHFHFTEAMHRLQFPFGLRL